MQDKILGAPVTIAAIVGICQNDGGDLGDRLQSDGQKRVGDVVLGDVVVGLCRKVDGAGLGGEDVGGDKAVVPGWGA